MWVWILPLCSRRLIRLILVSSSMKWGNDTDQLACTFNRTSNLTFHSFKIRSLLAILMFCFYYNKLQNYAKMQTYYLIYLDVWNTKGSCSCGPKSRYWQICVLLEGSGKDHSAFQLSEATHALDLQHLPLHASPSSHTKDSTWAAVSHTSNHLINTAVTKNCFLEILLNKKDMIHHLTACQGFYTMSSPKLLTLKRGTSLWHGEWVLKKRKIFQANSSWLDEIHKQDF